MDIDRRALIEALEGLVSTPSVNPSLGPGDGEAEAAELAATLLGDAGLEVERVEPERGRTSIVGTLRGHDPGPTLMLNGHLDTVPEGGMADAFCPRIDGDRLYGRGSYDMKGGVAACIAAARTLARMGAPFAGTLQVSAVADEEHGSLGTRAVLEGTSPTAVVVTEPTGLVPCSAHRGFAWIEIRTRGRAAHGSMPELGVDANLMMGRVLAAFDGMSGALHASEPHPILGRGSQHVSRLEGGGVPSVYADRCRLELERRTVPERRERTSSRRSRRSWRRFIARIRGSRPRRSSCSNAPPSRPRGTLPTAKP
jgi:acetylornithine deacetylase